MTIHFFFKWNQNCFNIIRACNSNSNFLELFYTNFLKFTIEFKKALIDLLLIESICFELFLHWSKTIRTVIMSFLLYHTCHHYRNNKISVTDEELFEQQYLIASKQKKNFSFYENRKEEE